jgi:hypothetical protein
MRKMMFVLAGTASFIAPAVAEMPREFQGKWCRVHTATALDVATRGPCRHPHRYEDTMTITADGYEFEGLTCKQMRTVKVESPWYFIKIFCVQAGQPLIQGRSTENETFKYGIVKGKLLINKDPRQ